MAEDLDVASLEKDTNASINGDNIGMSAEHKVKEQNRIRQLAFKVRGIMPKDYKSYCLVAAHLVKNAHRYWDLESKEGKEVKSAVENEIGNVSMESKDKTTECIEVNKRLREIQTLKRLTETENSRSW